MRRIVADAGAIDYPWGTTPYRRPARPDTLAAIRNPARISQVIARLVTGLALVALAACSREAGLTLDAAEAHARARAGTLVLIDVRRLDEQRDSGIAAGARSIDMSASQGEAGFHARVLRAVDGRKDQPIALLSDVGHRAANAQTSLERAGFSRV